MLEKAFAEMFCDEGTVMPRPNDFSSRETLILQCAIPRAMAKLRDPEDKVPLPVQQFFVDKLKFNDNSDNAFSDCHYIATLMNCLADSLVVSHREVAPAYHFSFGDEEPLEPENPAAEFEQTAIHEIERYRRIDEWILSYQNVYSTAAIECLLKLSKANIVKDKTRELLQYTLPSTANAVRLAAFRCLNEIGLTRRMPIMRHLLHSLADDPSPYFRERLLRLFGEAIGHIALQDAKDTRPNPQPAAPSDGLVLEQEASTDTLRIEATRNKNPEGALEALRLALQDDDVFKKALWYAATSPIISISEAGSFCDIAALLYDAVTSHHVVLKLPRLYNCQHLGNAKLRFFQRGPYRTAPRKGLSPDDWQTLQDHALQYDGPLSSDTKKRLVEVQQAEKLKQRIAQAQRQLDNAQAMSQYDMPPPPLLTPSSERTGFKLTLGGGAKRKASFDLGQREESPKSVKVTKTSTPSGQLVHPSHKKPLPNGLAKSVTPGPKPNGTKRSRVVILHIPLNLSTRFQAIVSSPPRPSKASHSPSHTVQRKTSQAPKSLTPSLPQHSPPTFPEPKSLMLSPSSGTGGLFASSSLHNTTPTPSLNIGGFRSFGPTPDPVPVSAEPPQPVSPSEIKHESVELDSSPSFSAADIPLHVGGGAGATDPSARSPSISQQSNGTSISHPEGPAPLKKKITLKLTSKSVRNSPD
ncbi:hypothetical protein MRB53_037718 [Persea americana]|nr:hypothetical protein MRB53_037718 [Persea americana]